MAHEDAPKLAENSHPYSDEAIEASRLKVEAMKRSPKEDNEAEPQLGDTQDNDPETRRDRVAGVVRETKHSLEVTLQHSLDGEVSPEVAELIQQARELDKTTFQAHLDLSHAAMDGEGRIIGANDGRSEDDLKKVFRAYRQARDALRTARQ